jgi:hypothetical protein
MTRPRRARLGLAATVGLAIGSSFLASPARAASEVVSPDSRAFAMGGASQG